ncbi:MAG: tRNA-(ms[2]io[6]A)-hydroxylase [Flavobacteriales bacterium]
MLGLKMETDPRWVNIVEQNIAEILTDHAYCEQKAASNAISMIVKFPEHEDLVRELTDICIEEMCHFKQVLEKIKERGLKMSHKRKDPYVNDLLQFVQKDGDAKAVLVDRLLMSAMIEARSCERFRILSQQLSDEGLRKFYHELMVSEASHYTTFIGWARKLGGNIDVNKRWEDFLVYEGNLMKKYGKSETIHG